MNDEQIKHKAKKIERGRYLYRGFAVRCLGYTKGGRACWEATDHDGSGFAHSHRLGDTKSLIDYELKREIEIKDAK